MCRFREKFPTKLFTCVRVEGLSESFGVIHLKVLKLTILQKIKVDLKCVNLNISGLLDIMTPG